MVNLTFTVKKNISICELFTVQAIVQSIFANILQFPS